ncbi:hypothetical protein BA723_04530 [Helicobacter sp. CLO-3]|nr:hypothetical protein BA723_04530 [Helicobacter sp. CLO-3]
MPATLEPALSTTLASQPELFATNHAYFGVFILLALSFVAFNYTLKIQRFISRKIARKNRDKLKLAPYECGPVPLKQPARISHHFFIIALLFVLFDIEVVFMIPWAIVYKSFVENGAGAFVFIEMLSFVGLLVVGLIYAWKKGALQWQDNKLSNPVMGKVDSANMDSANMDSANSATNFINKSAAESSFARESSQTHAHHTQDIRSKNV